MVSTLKEEYHKELKEFKEHQKKMAIMSLRDLACKERLDRLGLPMLEETEKRRFDCGMQGDEGYRNNWQGWPTCLGYLRLVATEKSWWRQGSWGNYQETPFNVDVSAHEMSSRRR